MYYMILLVIFSSLLSIILFLPYARNITHGVLNTIDPLFYAWNLAHNADTFTKGIDTMLNTNIFYPVTNTIAYSDTLWAQSMLTNPIIWLTNNPVLAQNIAIVLSFPASAVAFYLLAYYLTANPKGSAIGALLFSFSYPRLAQMGHLPMIWSQWLPLYILYLLKFLKSGARRDLIFLMLWYLLAIASSIYFGVFLIPVTAVVLMVDLAQRARSHALSVYKERFFVMLPLVIPFVLIVGLVMFPYIRLKIEYPELRRNLDDVTHLRASPIDYLSVLPTSLVAPFFPKNTNEHALFPTFTVLLLALTGFLLSKKNERFFIHTFLTIGLVSFILSFGNEQAFSIGKFSTGTLTLPYTWLYHVSPLFQTIRVPARFAIFVALSLSVLASFGITYLLKRKKSAVVHGAVVLFLMEIWQIHTPFISIPPLPPVYQWIKVQPEPMILAEMPISLFYNGTKMELQLEKTYHELLESDTYALETYRVYFSSYHKKRMINGYSGFLPDSYNRLAETLEDFPSEYSIDELKKIGVTHAVVHLWQYEDKDTITTKLTEFPELRLIYSDQHDMVYAIDKP